MKHKLDTFSEFAGNLYPHEADYLMGIQKFNKPVNIHILKTIHHNCYHQQDQREFDPSIDKRSYSYMKNWITQMLDKADVDKFYEWLINAEKQVMTDVILPDEEKEIIENLNVITPSHYYFLRFYELIEHFRDFLLIRVRNRFYRPTNNYLQKYEVAYQRSIAINKNLNRAAEEIIRQHETFDVDPITFNDFLQSTFSDESLDGYTRYRAAVRLTFLFYNYREFEQLRVLYNDLDKLFKTNLFYSKRILANYYSNRAMMHSKLNELETAEKYGYFSIIQKNSDYFFYLANLCGVLLRARKYEKALKLMSASIPDLKNTGSIYNRIGFASFYTRTLVYNNMAKKAVSYASTFLEAYKKEVFETRWHLFFSAYLEALLHAEKYDRVVAIANRYNLLSMEKMSSDKTVYLPILLWITEVALYMKGKRTKQKIIEIILASAQNLLKNRYKAGRITELLEILSLSIPEEVAYIRRQLSALKSKTE
jgi:hypothetical protein